LTVHESNVEECGWVVTVSSHPPKLIRSPKVIVIIVITIAIDIVTAAAAAFIIAVVVVTTVAVAGSGDALGWCCSGSGHSSCLLRSTLKQKSAEVVLRLLPVFELIVDSRECVEAVNGSCRRMQRQQTKKQQPLHLRSLSFLI
jgi:hypothetical protein